jgi:hypothetical protein
MCRISADKRGFALPVVDAPGRDRNSKLGSRFAFEKVPAEEQSAKGQATEHARLGNWLVGKNDVIHYNATEVIRSSSVWLANSEMSPP